MLWPLGRPRFLRLLVMKCFNLCLANRLQHRVSLVSLLLLFSPGTDKENASVAKQDYIRSAPFDVAVVLDSIGQWVVHPFITASVEAVLSGKAEAVSLLCVSWFFYLTKNTPLTHTQTLSLSLQGRCCSHQFAARWKWHMDTIPLSSR